MKLRPLPLLSLAGKDARFKGPACARPLDPSRAADLPDDDSPQPVLLQMGKVRARAGRRDAFRGRRFSGMTRSPPPNPCSSSKVGKDCFNMDYQYPLSMLQAFAICLSRFDAKIPP